MKKFSFDFVASEFSNSNCELLEKTYCNNRTLLKYRCQCGKISFTRFDDFQRGVRCKTCGYKRHVKHSNLVLTLQQKELLIGSMLGDGSLTKIYSLNYNSAFVETHSTKQRNYLGWKQDILNPFSYKSLIETQHAAILPKQNGKLVHDKNRMLPACVLKTTTHFLFTELEKEWYKRIDGRYTFNEIGYRIKIVPSSLKLTPFSLAVWYFDDGYINQKERYFVICSQSFTKDECLYLREQIKSVGIKNEVTKENKIYIGRQSYLEFCEMLKVHLPHAEMSYKLGRLHNEKS